MSDVNKSCEREGQPLVSPPIEDIAMNTILNGSDLSLMLAVMSVVLCPTLCGIMAYRISRAGQQWRSQA